VQAQSAGQVLQFSELEQVPSPHPTHCPEPLHVSEPVHVPQDPPQPSEPQLFPLHCLVQHDPFTQVALRPQAQSVGQLLQFSPL